MTFVLDAGAFVSVERGNQKLVADLRRDYVAGVLPITHGGVIGQVWRGGSGTQARLARLLKMTQVVPLGDALGRRVGELLAASGTRDVIDAAVVLLARNGDVVVTSDPDDIRWLAVAARRRIDIVQI